MLYNPPTITVPAASINTVGNPTSSTATITTTDSVALAANSNRKKTIIFNAGSTRAYINFTSAASLTSYAFWIEPAGYFIDDVSPTTAAIHAITASGTTSLNIQEF